MGGAIGSFVPLIGTGAGTGAKVLVIISNGVVSSMVKMQ